MKTKHYIGALFLGVILGLPACSDQNEDTSNIEGYLKLDLSVNEQNNVIMTRSSDVSVDTFAVKIEKVGGGIIKDNLTYEELKANGTLRLEAGQYTVTAHSLSHFYESSGHPYYSGTKDFEILPNTFADARVICSMQHARIQVKLSDDLLSSIDDYYEVSVSNGDLSHYYSFTDGISEDWYFDPSFGSFTIKITGTVLESGESFEIESDIPKTVYANDFLTINLGVETKATRSLATSEFNIKVTVEQ